MTPDRPSTAPDPTRELRLEFLPRLVRRDLHVRRTQEVTPRYRRVVLAGEDLDAGFPLARFAPTDHVRAYFPDPVTAVLAAYRPVGDPAEDVWEVDVEGAAPIHRDYTVRAWDPAARELTLDFVVHDHGVAAQWARSCRPGDPLVVIGPRAHWLLPRGYRHYLAAGDATALPAISRLVEEAPSGARVTAVVEVEGAAEEQGLVPAPGTTAELHWVHRGSSPVAPGHLSALETALHDIVPRAATGSLYVLAAGEAGALKPVRRFLRDTLGLPREQMHVDGYWKRGVVDHDHHQEVEDDDEVPSGTP